MSQPSNSRQRVLALGYSQSGQLNQILERILAPLRESAQIDVHYAPLEPCQPFPFPWPVLDFLDAVPESALMQPAPVQALALADDARFDLIIIAYQVWFLAPSQPVVAFLQSEQGKRLLHNTPVVTLLACRNMWLQAHLKMQRLLADCGAQWRDNIVLTDAAHPLASLITTPRWVLTGQRNAFCGLPAAGVSAADIAASRRFGLALRDALVRGEHVREQPMLSGLQAVRAQPNLYFSEQAGTRSFYLWSRLLRAAGQPGALLRRALLLVYLAFLIVLIMSVVPLSLAVQRLLRPLFAKRLARIKEQFEAPSGSGAERMSAYHVHEH